MKKQETNNIHPIFDRLLQRADKEQFLQQRGIVLWMTGLSGSGKSTIAQALETRLHNAGFFTQVLDGDNVRMGINRNLGFSDEDRNENIRRIGEIAKLFLQSGIITICTFVSPTIAIRNLARQIVGDADFCEVYINAPLEVCEQRDVKGLYKKARAGQIKDFTGIDAPFEPPVSPDIEIHTDQLSVEEAVDAICKVLVNTITL